jgi:hypothetical protein
MTTTNKRSTQSPTLKHGIADPSSRLAIVPETPRSMIDSTQRRRHTIHTFGADTPTGLENTTPRRPSPAHLGSVQRHSHSHWGSEPCGSSALGILGPDWQASDGSPGSITHSQTFGSSSETLSTPPAFIEAATVNPPEIARVYCSGHSIQFHLNSQTTFSSGERQYEEDPIEAIDFASKEYSGSHASEDVNPNIATREQLDALKAAHPLPKLDITDWKSPLRYLAFTFYRRLMLIVLLANTSVIAVMIARARQRPGSFTYGHAATATGANLMAAALMRQEHVINMFFHLACSLPNCSPLCLRRFASKMAYNNGGVHAGAGQSALLWYIFYTVLLLYQFQGTEGQQTAIAAVTAVTIFLFVIIIGMSHPRIRQRYHDAWELSHRYCGWAAIGCVWAQTIIIAVSDSRSSMQSVIYVLVRNPTFWFLITITVCLVYPWLWLRRLPVDANKLSKNATELRFHNRDVPCCVGTRLSETPLLDNHGFATIATPDLEKGYSVVVSKSGDWTERMIKHPPTHIWQRGAPTIGVMRLSSLFKPIVIVATGSGIGPAASFLNVFPDHPMRILWSAGSPEARYSDSMIANVLRADKDAVIVDTHKTGPLDLPALAYALVKEVKAEAVMVISNPKATKEVVYAMEARKIPAFGAIFDS